MAGVIMFGRLLRCSFDTDSPDGPEILQSVEHALDNFFGRLDPVRGPDAVQLPTERLQDLLTQSVPIPSRPVAVVCCSVTLDAQDVTLRMFWMTDPQVDAEARRPDLAIDRQPMRFEALFYGLLEIVQFHRPVPC